MMNRLRSLVLCICLILAIAAFAEAATVFETIQFRRGTAAEWAAENPIPAQGEPCYETDTGFLKIGDGVTHYNSLPSLDTASALPGVTSDGSLGLTVTGAVSASGFSSTAADGGRYLELASNTTYTPVSGKYRVVFVGGVLKIDVNGALKTPVLADAPAITGQLVSTVATGTAPFSVASTTVVPNLNCSTLTGATWSAPNGIGWVTPNTGKFTNVSATSLLYSSTAPTISSGFGTTPSIAANNGTASFRVNVGTGGAATAGVIGLPTASNGWNCWCNDITTASATVFLCKQTASTASTATIGNFNTSGAAAAWVASDILSVSCFAY